MYAPHTIHHQVKYNTDEKKAEFVPGLNINRVLYICV